MRVLSMSLSDGSRKFCDARCHNSQNSSRPCICHGLLRGKGHHYAMLNAPKAQQYVHRIEPDGPAVWLNPRLVKDF